MHNREDLARPFANAAALRVNHTHRLFLGDGNSFIKEVFHPQVLLRIPCYDLVPINSFTLGPLNRGTSGAPIFRDLTGGEYKTQELIQRAMADARLLAIPTS